MSVVTPRREPDRASIWRGDGYATLSAWYERALATLGLPHAALDVPTPAWNVLKLAAVAPTASAARC